MVNERQERAARAEQMRKDREKADKRQRNVITIGIITAVVALIVVAAFAVNAANDKRRPNTELIPPAGATKDFGIVYGPTGIGAKPAKDMVRVVIYEDLQCPVCRMFEAASGKFLQSAVKQGDIEVEYRFVAFLDDLGRSQNKYSHRASNAVLCARESGDKEFKITHDILYLNQPEENTLGPDDNTLVDRVIAAGVPKAKAEECVLKHKYVPWINAATKAMGQHKVKGTPSIWVAGKEVKGKTADGQETIASTADLQAAIDAAKK